MYELEKVVATFAECEHLDDESFCLVFCSYDWKIGDDHLLLYRGETRASCIEQAIADHVVSLDRLKRILLTDGWAAVGREYEFDEEEVDTMRSQFSPWEFVRVYEVMEDMASYRIEKALSKASFEEYCALWRVGSLRDFLTLKK